MGNGTTFTSAEEMQAAYNQLWSDMASFFSDIPSYFSEVLDFAGQNPLAVIVIGLFIAFLAFHLLRCVISSFSGSRR